MRLLAYIFVPCKRIVVNEVHHHTSVIKTLRERWDLGAPRRAQTAEVKSDE